MRVKVKFLKGRKVVEKFVSIEVVNIYEAARVLRISPKQVISVISS